MPLGNRVLYNCAPQKNMSENESPGDITQMVNVGVAAAERGDYEGALRLLSNVYRIVPPEKYPQGLSAYGLCVAKFEKKNKVGADLCQKAIELQPYEGKHYANLVRVFIAGKNRRKAVDVLHNGLAKTRNDEALVQVREEIGYRRAPYFEFLDRRHPLNKLYSRTAGRLKRRGKIIALTIMSLIYLAAVALVFLAVRQ
jgi:tetratricopeptide (TPR) repeat protein